MKIASTTKLFQLAAIAAAFAMTSGDTMAWSYGSYGSTGSYGSYGSSASYGSYGSGGSYGSYGSRRAARVANRQARRAARGSYGSYGSYGSTGSYGSYGSYGSTGSYGSYGSAGSCGSSGSTMIYSTPEESEPAAVEPPADDSASIEVTLPAIAKVYVNDKLTTSTGSYRQFISRGLRSDRSYTYNVRVEYEHEGQLITQQRSVKLKEGDRIVLDFNTPASEGEVASAASAPQPVKTELTVHVPDGAKVFLAGASTKQQGKVRQYGTTRLAQGEQWKDYTVRVELEQDGKTLVQEQTLQLEGGQNYELAFDFTATDNQIAMLTK